MSRSVRRTPARLLLAGALVCAACGGGEPRLSAVLITVDTTNPGALSCYGRREGTTPHIDALAAESVRYDRARATAPITLPSHASMHTGLYPLRHTVRDNGIHPVPASALTLAERARDAGYDTAAFVGAVVLDRHYGLDQGFDVYDVPAGNERAAGHFVERTAEEVTEAARAWLRARDSDEPFFLWVHYFDPHSPYVPPQEDLVAAGGNAYLGEVIYMDRWIGALLDELRAAWPAERTVVALAADHGESLGRHDEPTHAVFCYDATMHVPMMVRHPDGWRAGEGSDEPVSVADLYPTLVEALGLGAPGDIDGTSLWRRVVPPERGVYLESYDGFLNHGWSPLAGWVERERKYLHSSQPELYDLAADPRERTNLYDGDPASVRPFRDALAHLAELPTLAVDAFEGFGEEQRAQIRALGYVGLAETSEHAPHPLEDTGLPAPAERTAELNAFYRGGVLFNQGKPDEAIEVFRQVAESNPSSVYAWSFLGAALYGEERYDEAIEALESLLKLGYDRPQVRDFLAASYQRRGDLDAAVSNYRRAHELTPRDPTRLRSLLRALGQQAAGEETEEIVLLRRLLESLEAAQ